MRRCNGTIAVLIVFSIFFIIRPIPTCVQESSTMKEGYSRRLYIRPAITAITATLTSLHIFSLVNGEASRTPWSFKQMSRHNVAARSRRQLLASPTPLPTLQPTLVPTSPPTLVPTSPPTLVPTLPPTSMPSLAPTPRPTYSLQPSDLPTLGPTSEPTISPIPTSPPTTTPTGIPTSNPTLLPSPAPSPIPTISRIPSPIPSPIPTSMVVVYSERDLKRFINSSDLTLMLGGNIDLVPVGVNSTIFTINSSVTGLRINFNGFRLGFQNSNGTNGRVFVILAGAEVEFTGLNITNAYSSFGGAMYNGGTVTFIGSTSFSSCYSSSFGGALVNNGTLTFHGEATFTSCSALLGGGAIYSVGTIIANAGIYFSNCNANEGFGGAIYKAGGIATLSGPTFLGNFPDDIYGTVTCSSICDGGTYAYFSRYANSDSSTQCPSYEDCIDCPAGTYSSTADAISSLSVSDCSACGVGQFSAAGVASCTDCPLGKYASDDASETGGGIDNQVLSNAISCNDCPAGYYGTSTLAIVCSVCSSGKTSNAGSSSCSNCPTGKAAPSIGSASCANCPVGKFADRTGQSSCYLCGVGKYANVTGSRSCSKCAAGSYSAKVESNCTACEIGRYNMRMGSTGCLLCAAGSYVGREGSRSCTSCPAGQYSRVGASACDICVAGKYNFVRGASSCSNCPVGKYSGNEGSVSCANCTHGFAQPAIGQPLCEICESGKFAGVGYKYCLDCPTSRYSDEGAPNCDFCDVGYFLDANSEYYHSKDTSTGLCRPCPKFGVKCKSVGQTVEELEIKPGFWRRFKDDWAVRRCPVGAACVGGTNFDDSYCEEGAEGPYCQVCSEKFFRASTSGLGFRCKRCDKENIRLSLLMLGISSLGVLIAACYCCRDRGEPENDELPEDDESFLSTEEEEKEKEISKVEYEQKKEFIYHAQSKIRVLVVFCQIISNLGYGLQIEFPKGYSQLLSILSVFSIDLFQFFPLGCLMQYDHYDKLALMTLTPIVISIFLISLHLLFRRSSLCRSRWRENGTDIFFATFLAMMYLILPAVSNAIFATFKCVKYDDETQFLRADYTLFCEEGGKQIDGRALWVTYAFGMVFVYPVGIPLLFSVLLYQRRYELCPSMIGQKFWWIFLRQPDEGGERGIEDEERITYLAFLHEPFSTQYFWWEIVEILRRLILSSVLLFYDTFGVSQIVVAMLSCLAFNRFHAYHHPYAEDDDDILAEVIQWNLFCVLLTSLLIRVDAISNQRAQRQLLSVTLIGITLISFLLTFTLLFRNRFCEPRVKVSSEQISDDEAANDSITETAADSITEKAAEPTSWKCVVCKRDNEIDAVVCTICSTSRTYTNSKYLALQQAQGDANLVVVGGTGKIAPVLSPPFDEEIGESVKKKDEVLHPSEVVAGDEESGGSAKDAVIFTPSSSPIEGIKNLGPRGDEGMVKLFMEVSGLEEYTQAIIDELYCEMPESLFEQNSDALKDIGMKKRQVRRFRNTLRFLGGEDSSPDSLKKNLRDTNKLQELTNYLLEQAQQRKQIGAN